MTKPTKQDKIKTLIVAYNAVIEELRLEGYTWSECVRRTNNLL